MKQRGERVIYVFHKTLVNSHTKKHVELLLCLSFSFLFSLFFSSQTTSEDDFSGDEWLGFMFLGVMEAR